MRSVRKTASIAALVGASVALAACSAGPASSTSATTAGGKVAIQVAIDAGLQKSAVDAIDKQVAAFEKANPDIKVTTREYTWTGTTFSAELAGGTLPDVFTVPFTDGRGLIEQGQVADISKLVAKLPYSKKFNKTVLANGENTKGDVLAVPVSAYGQALHYNRQLFTKAGLDPDKPPTTWEELMADAKQISDKTGAAGYASMSENNTGGWLLSTMTYALGGRMQKVSGGKPEATLDNPETKQALEYLKQMRWTDNSMGSNFLYVGNNIDQDFAAGKIGMFIKGADTYTSLVQQDSIDPSIYGESVVPLADNPNAGALGGGTLAVVNVKATAAQQAAAVKWIDYFYLQKLVDKDAAVTGAQISKDDGQPVGTPSLPIFDKATYDQQQQWIKSYVNVPSAQMTSYTDHVFDQKLIPEMTYQTQAIYALLDPVLQSVLTNKNADIDALLKQANTSAQSLLDQN